MIRAMVFIDHMNFTNSLKDYYQKEFGEVHEPRLDYKKFPHELVKAVCPGVYLSKTFLFAPKPDDFLRTDTYWDNYYKWVTGMKNYKNFDVIEGDYVHRPVYGVTSPNIKDKSTYYKVEKGTDINMAVHVITKAFHNSFDIGILVSGDSDYAMVLQQLKTIGKIGVIAAVKGQNIERIKPQTDSNYIMDKNFFDLCLRNG